MSFTKASVRDAEVEGRRVLVRVDFNVPLSDGRVSDDSRIRAALPTIELLRERGAKLILVSHLGRPDGPDPDLSLAPVAERLGALIGTDVRMAPGLVGPEVEALVDELGPGDVLMLENSRFEPGEKTNDPELARGLAKLADLYVNDAFGAAHRVPCHHGRRRRTCSPRTRASSSSGRSGSSTRSVSTRRSRCGSCSAARR